MNRVALLRRLKRYTPEAQQRWRDERRNALAEAMAAGMTMPELAALFGTSKQWISKALELPAKKTTRRSIKG